MTALTPFPFDELVAFYVDRIKALGPDPTQEAAIARLTICFCHWSPVRQYGPWSGFRAILEEAQIAEANGEAKRPALIFGMHSPAIIPDNDDTALRDWPGVRYLRYDVGDDELFSSYKICLAGSTEPLPSHLKANLRSLLNLLSNVRHLLQTRTITVRDRLDHLEKAAKGMPFSQAQAELPQVFTEDQQRMLERFRKYSPIALSLLSGLGGLVPLMAMLQKLKEQWKHVAQLVTLLPAGDVKTARAALEVMQQVEVTIKETISIIQSLEKALKEMVENIE